MRCQLCLFQPSHCDNRFFIELYSFRGVRHHSAELTCVATRHTFPEQHKVRRLLLQKVVHPNDVVSSKSIFQGAFERMTKDMTASGPTTMKIMVVAPPDGKSSLLAPDISVRRPSWIVVRKTNVEESPVAVQGTAPLRQSKSVPICGWESGVVAPSSSWF